MKRKLQKMDKLDKIVFLIGSIVLWILVVIAILHRYFNNLGNYWVSIYMGISTNILCWIIIKIPIKKRKKEQEVEI